MRVLEAPQGGGSARREKTTGWKRVLPASPPSGLEGLRFKNPKLRFGRRDHDGGLIVRKRDIAFHLTAY